MALFGKAVQTGTIWLTAIMLLIAGAPHFVCRCPNGNVKSYCLFLLSGKNGCCCDGSCDSAPRGEAVNGLAEKSCCRCANHRHSAGDTSAEFGKAGCRKTPAKASVAIAESSARDLTGHLFVAAPEIVLSHDGFADDDGPFADRSLWPPPPTDLITVLQRFLI